MGVLCDASTASMSPQPPSDAPVSALETRRSIRNAPATCRFPPRPSADYKKHPIP